MRDAAAGTARRACSSRCSPARARRSWGIGEIGDLAPLTAWLAAGGQRALQLLPINEMAPSQQSPYSAISAMAIDPIYISLASGAGLSPAKRRSRPTIGRCSRASGSRPRSTTPASGG